MGKEKGISKVVYILGVRLEVFLFYYVIFLFLWLFEGENSNDCLEFLYVFCGGM